MPRIVRSLVVPIGFILLMTPGVRAGQIGLVSTAATESDTATGLGSSWYDFLPPAVSADGRWIAFGSTAVNLVPGQRDRNESEDVFLRDRQTGTTVLVSHASGSAGSTAASGGRSGPASISDDGRWIVYESTVDDLVPGQVPIQSTQIFLYDRDTGINTLLSHSTAGPGVSSNGSATSPRISGDGNWIAFDSAATDLLPSGQFGTPGLRNVFLHERSTGQSVLVSRAAGTTLTAADHHSGRPAVSDDGRWVAFLSQASDLIPGFSSGTFPTDPNVFVFDRVTGVMVLASHTSASASTGAGGWDPEISPDGAAVVFGSKGSDLVPGQTDTASSPDLFLFDRASGANLLVSHAPSSLTTAAGGPLERSDFQVAAGGAWVAYIGAFAGNWQILLFRRSDSSVTLVSRSAASPSQGANGFSYRPRLTPDGAFVIFESRATDLVAGQTGAFPNDVFLFDRAAGTLVLASGAGGSGQATGNSSSTSAAISDDGSVVAFYTWATDLVPGTADLNGTRDLVLYDRAAAASTLASLHAPGQASVTPSASSVLASASADGRYAVLLSRAVNLVPGQVDRSLGTDVFLADRVAGTVALVSRKAGTAATAGNGESLDAAISADGAHVVFLSRSTDLVPGQIDTNLEDLGFGVLLPGVDVFLYDRAAGTTTLVSHVAGSSVTASDVPCLSEWNSLDAVSLSADGRYLGFLCEADDLVPGQTDDNFLQDTFLYDRVTDATTLVSHKAGTVTTAAGDSLQPRISGDGRWIAFLSLSTDLVAGGTDTNGQYDLFLFDRISGQMFLVSRAAGTAATAANHSSQEAALSADGRYVTFTSLAGNLVPGQTGTGSNVFLFDRVTGTVELISRAAGTATTTAYGSGSSVSDDGRYVAFLSTGANLVPGQTAPPGTPQSNVFVHDRVTRQTELITRSVLSPLRTSNRYARKPSLSPDGRYLAFSSRATDLAAAPTDHNIFLADRQLHTLERVGEAASTGYFLDSTGRSEIPRVSADGSVVLFTSGGVDLVSGDVGDLNGADDVFAYARSAPAGSDFFTVAPCRLIDTRQAGQGPALTSGVPALLTVHGACGIPGTADAIALNVTVLQPEGPGLLTLHPGNLSTPATSTINFTAGQNRANNAILALASNGEGTLGITPLVSGGGTAHVIVDVTGYFQQE